MSLLSSITSFFHGEKRISSSEFEHAVNEVLLSDTVADHTKRHYPTAEGAPSGATVMLASTGTRLSVR